MQTRLVCKRKQGWFAHPNKAGLCLEEGRGARAKVTIDYPDDSIYS